MADLFQANALQTIDFFVAIEPRGKGRPRVRVMTIHGKSVPTVYTDAETKKYEAEVARFAVDAKVKQGWKVKPEVLLTLDVTAYFFIPKSWSKKDHAFYAGRPADNRIDCDNVCKSVGDALNNILYIDDKAIVAMSCRKFYTADYAAQGLQIRVSECG